MTLSTPRQVMGTHGSGSSGGAGPDACGVSVTIAGDCASAMSQAVALDPVDVRFVWPADAQLSLTAEQWRDAELTVERSGGDLTIADVTLQSLPPVSTTSKRRCWC